MTDKASRLKVGSWWCAIEGYTPCQVAEIDAGRVKVEYADGGWGSFTTDVFLAEHDPSGALYIARGGVA